MWLLSRMLSHEAEKIQVNVFVDVRKWEMLWSAGLCSALSHSTLDGRGSYLFRTSLLPSSLHFSLPSSCVAVVLVSTATFLSLKSPTIMLPAVLLPSCGGMYVRAFSSPFNIYTCAFLCFPSPFLVFISPFLHLSPSHFFCRLPARLRQECTFLHFWVLGWVFAEENQKKKYWFWEINHTAGQNLFQTTACSQ